MAFLWFVMARQWLLVVQWFDIWMSQKNLVGELEAALIAAKQALELDCTRLVIVYDCESIETLAAGKSTPKSRVSKYYVSEMNEYMKQLDITFSYSKAHSGNEWHNFADRLAREGCGLK